MKIDTFSKFVFLDLMTKINFKMKVCVYVAKFKITWILKLIDQTNMPKSLN